MTAQNALLESIVSSYLESSGFDGVPLRPEQRETAAELVEQGLVQIVSGSRTDYPHIRAWNSRPEVQEQLEDLIDEQQFVCAYPTAAAMAGDQRLARMASTPFRQRIAAGTGQMELSYFTVDVVEAYINDPRLHCG